MARNTVPEWSTNADSNTDVAGVNIAENCAPSGINNSIRAIMAQIATYIGGGIASRVDMLVGTVTNKFFAPTSIKTLNATSVVADAPTVALDLSTYRKFRILKTQTGNITFANAVVDYEYELLLIQDGTGGRGITLTPPSGVTFRYKPANLFSTTANSWDRVHIEVWSATEWLITIARGYS